MDTLYRVEIKNASGAWVESSNPDYPTMTEAVCESLRDEVLGFTTRVIPVPGR